MSSVHGKWLWYELMTGDAAAANRLANRLDRAHDAAEDVKRDLNRLAEEGRVNVRNARRDAHEKAKKAKLPEDEGKRLEKEIQTATDNAIKEINDHLAAKEKELMTF